MSGPVSITRHGDIAVLLIDSPPVNALGHAVRVGLLDALAVVRADAGVVGMVLACAGRTFCAGADISEFGHVKPPMLREVIGAIEALGKPSVAALHGTALGGGFELALACNHRIAAKGAKVGLPEVKLGLLPGAGGTVRATYLCGPSVALKMMATGEPLGAEAALSAGLVDAIAEGDLTADAVAFLRARMAAGTVAPPIVARRPPPCDMAAFEREAAALLAKARSSAPVAVVSALRAALTRPADEALREERRLFDAAVAGPISAALRHLFFAERAAARLPEPEQSAPVRTIATVGVIGAGTMGTGIAMALANAGLQVVLREVAEEALDRGLARVHALYAGSVSRGSLTDEAAAARAARISGTTSLADLAGCDLVIEAAFEDMAVKKEIFAALDAIAKPGAILATNTSYLDVNEIASVTARPQDVVGLHFFSPAHVMKLLEVVRGARTAPDVMASAMALARRLGKIPVAVGVCRGFVGNRMLAARNGQNGALLLEGALPQEVDGAFRRFGWPMGPFEMQDMAGLDISWRNRKALGLQEPVADALCEAGRFGQKAGAGWYDYGPDGKPVPSAQVEAIIRALADARSVARRAIGEGEIIARTHGPMIAEGEAILAEGIAARASDIDVIWVHGYGFPRDLGGPMFWAQSARAAGTG